MGAGPRDSLMLVALAADRASDRRHACGARGRRHGRRVRARRHGRDRHARVRVRDRACGRAVVPAARAEPARRTPAPDASHAALRSRLASRHEGTRLRGGRGDAARGADARHEQAPAPGGELADGLLPAAAAAARRHPRGARRHRQGPCRADDRPARRRPTLPSAGRTRRCSSSISPTRCRPGPAGSPRWSGWPRTSRAASRSWSCSATTSSSTRTLPRSLPGVRGGGGAQVFVKDVPDPENFGVVVYDDDGQRRSTSPRRRGSSTSATRPRRRTTRSSGSTATRPTSST